MHATHTSYAAIARMFARRCDVGAAQAMCEPPEMTAALPE